MGQVTMPAPATHWPSRTKSHASKGRLDGQVAEPFGLGSAYRDALRRHLEGPCEATLQQAFELGRSAMDAGAGIFDLIGLHHQALALGVFPEGSRAVPIRAAPALESFLLGALSPFRGAVGDGDGAWERRCMKQAEQNEVLSQRIARLEEEIEDHRRAETAIKESKDHYFRLYQEARAMQANLRELSAQVLSAQEDERKRISRELHDEIGQALIAINVTISMLKRQAISDPAFQSNVADAERLLARTMEKVHSFARELRPAMLDHLGLQSALRALILEFTRQTGIRTELVPHAHLSRLDGRREEVFFRVAQEALSNAFKHAGATAVKIEFTSKNDDFSMEIGDDGCSFSVEEKLGGKFTGRLGILGMQERVRHVDGSFAIESVSGSGTRICVTVPLGAQAHRQARTRGEDDSILPSLSSAHSYPCLYEENICTAR